MNQSEGRYIQIADTRLYVVERGEGYPIFILHGGPGLDHHGFGDYLDPLAREYKLVFVDQRSQGLSDKTTTDTWSIKQMAHDVVMLSEAMDFGQYAVLGHSYGALVALQNAVDFPGKASHTIISSGFPSARFLKHVEGNLKNFEPIELREQVASSWARETEVKTEEEAADLLHDQMPFHFANPLDTRIQEFEERTTGAVYSPDVLRHFSNQEYGGIEVENRLQSVIQPVLVLVGRHDRVCSVEASQVITGGIPNADLVVFEQSGHMTFVEENDRYLNVVREFLNRPMQ